MHMKENRTEMEKHFSDAERWCRVIKRLKKGYDLSFCSKFRQRISWDWMKAHHALKKANKEIMNLSCMVSDREFVEFLENQKIKI